MAANLNDTPVCPRGWMLQAELQAHSWDWLRRVSSQRGSRLGEGIPATSPSEGRHDPPWAWMLSELALLKA